MGIVESDLVASHNQYAESIIVSVGPYTLYSLASER